MADPTVLGDLLDRVSLETTNLRRLAAMSQEELHADPDRLYGVKHRFVVAIEAAIDASRHFALTKHLRSARDFADAFVVLGEANLLTEELVDRLKGMARFRNLLVHGYAVVDDTRVVEILKHDLGDFDEFRRQIAAAIDVR